MDSGTSCVVTCNYGYELSGHSSSVCGSDGGWDPRTTANCRGKKKIHVNKLMNKWLKQFKWILNKMINGQITKLLIKQANF